MINERGSEKLKEGVRCGRTSITYAYAKIRREEKHQVPPPLPKGEFAVIYAGLLNYFAKSKIQGLV